MDSVQGLEWFELNSPTFLTHDTINPAIKDPTSIKIIKFFTPWCRYCRIIKDYIDKYKKAH
jgi:thiol-disulfide isomerase/thioredoxin